MFNQKQQKAPVAQLDRASVYEYGEGVGKCLGGLLL